MDIEKIKKYAQLVAQKRKVQAMLKDLDASINVYRETVLADYAESGIQSCKVDTPDGQANVFIRRQIWANAKNGHLAEAVRALKDSGLDFLVEEKFNTHSLSAWVREQLDMITDSELEEKIARGLPPAVAANLQITERIDLGVNVA